MNKQTDKNIGLIPDTNWIINIVENQGPLSRTINKFRKSKLKIIIPKFVLHETKKIRGYSELETINKLQSCLPGKINVVTINQDVMESAKELEEKYARLHFPDSIILAYGRMCAYTILSYDHGLLDSAIKEGVQTFTPKKGGLG
ncbi:PIN domain-containing protein [Candidatus Nitrosopumilus sediminis]|uniref:PIN domain-containing protein n=1 Tax=Candidatus Nitrosopumilus sediminis TaxID=1229909 RepID=K0BB27_9ARCH|nr:PIN domain-containing protein [Candidatus Nitrosopumilus sediminis]AFS83373.1 hypothetical protein NSED_07905 [Candidatus Nitrosopumilus sediminis]